MQNPNCINCGKLKHIVGNATRSRGKYCKSCAGKMGALAHNASVQEKIAHRERFKIALRWAELRFLYGVRA